MRYLELSVWQVISGAALAVVTVAGLLVLAYAAGHSRGAAVRDQNAARKLAERAGRIAELAAALDRAEQACEDAGDRARSATAQALASATMLREAAGRLQEQAEREVNKIIAAADQPSAAARTKGRAAA